MKLKRIIFTLSFLTFLSAALGGWFYYASLRNATLKDAYYQAEVRVQMLSRQLYFFFSENAKPARALSGMNEIRRALLSGGREALQSVNEVLDNHMEALGLEAAYLMNAQGVTIASSNRATPESFVGKDFSFRSYFQQAIRGQSARYLALGATSGRRGAYCSHPVYAKGRNTPIGVVVLKASIEQVEVMLFSGLHETVLVTAPSGVIFLTNKPEFLYRLLENPTPDTAAQIAATRQFGGGPWEWAGFSAFEDGVFENEEGRRYLVNRAPIAGFPGWQVFHLRDMEEISQQIFGPFITVSTLVMLVLFACVGGLVLILYGMANQEIKGRKDAEDALAESEERYRMIYHNTPAMLHSIDRDGRLIHVSDYWLEWAGYTREAVIGRKLTDYFTDASRHYAETHVFPEFFKAGASRNTPYQFVRKSGEVIDILTSGYGVRDGRGEVERSIAVSVDVTERNRARRDLEEAKEKLSQYSRKLEALVRKRTGEITSIFEHTPAVIYIKNADGTYRLVNSSFEKLFNVKGDEVSGLSGGDFLPPIVAGQFEENDGKVLLEKQTSQVRERIPGPDAELTLLSTKFPFYDEAGSVTGICSVSIDITELQETQDKLRSLSGSIMASQERERASIARELHDQLGQVLTVLRMDAVWLEKRFAERDEKTADRAASMSGLIAQTIQDVREMAYRLRPAILDDLGLVAALDALTADFEKRTGIACVYESSGVYEDRGEISTAVYRIVQEALTNVARHANADRVDVVLAVLDNAIEVTISDNGRGFDPEALPEGGFGLAGMTERAALAGGHLDIQSKPGGGATVHCTIPL